MLFTGAGFSKPWGGFLGSELSSLLVSHPRLARNWQARQQLLMGVRAPNRRERCTNYEEIIAEWQKNSPAIATEAIAAVQEIFDRQHFWMRRAGDMRNVDAIRDLILTVRRHESTKSFSIFTLNNDLFQEQMLTERASDPDKRIKWSYGFLDEENAKYASNIGDGNSRYPTVGFERGTPFKSVSDPEVVPLYKLHGSFNWRDATSDAPVLIAGGQKKDGIETMPCLAGMFHHFERLIMDGPVDILVIGYGFNDVHINKVLFDACHESNDPDMDRLRFFRIDPESMGTWGSRLQRINFTPNIRTSLNSLTSRTCGYYEMPLDAFFYKQGSPTPFWEDLISRMLS